MYQQIGFVVTVEWGRPTGPRAHNPELVCCTQRPLNQLHGALKRRITALLAATCILYKVCPRHSKSQKKKYQWSIFRQQILLYVSDRSGFAAVPVFFCKQREVPVTGSRIIIMDGSFLCVIHNELKCICCFYTDQVVPNVYMHDILVHLLIPL